MNSTAKAGRVREAGNILVASLVLFFASLSPSLAVDISWTNTAGGNWSAAANWSPNTVPGSGDNAFITNAGTYTVTLDVSATVNDFTLGDSLGQQGFSINGTALAVNGTGTFNANTVLGLSSGGTLGGGGNLTIGGTFNWMSGTTVSGAGLLTFAPGSSINMPEGQFFKNLSQRTLNNQGTVTWTGNGGGLSLAGGAAINNEAGALFDAQGNSEITGSGSFTNAGTLRKSGGAGITTIGIPVNNTGTVQAQSGELDLSEGGASSGSFTVAVGATLGFAGAHNLSSASTVSGAGLVKFLAVHLTDNFTDEGSYNITGSNTLNGNSGSTVTVTLDGPVSLGTNLLTVYGNLFITLDQTLNGTVNLVGGQLGGSGNLTIGGTFNWMSGATVSGAGLLTFAPGSVINLSEGQFFKILNQRKLNNQTMVTWTGTGGGLSLANGASINNQAGAVFDAQGNSPISGSGTFTNAGTLRKSAGTGTTTIGVPINNTGTVQAQSGELDLSAGGTSSGSFTVATGATLGFAGAHNLSSASTVSGAGSVKFPAVHFTDSFTDEGSYNVTGSNTVNGNSGSTVTVTLDGPVNLGTNLLTVSGNLFITPDQTLNGTVNLLGGQLGGSGNLTMGGTFNWMAGTTVSGAGLLTFAPGSVISLSEGQFFKALNQRKLNNQTTVTWTGTGGGLFLMNGASINNQAGALFDAQGNSPISGSGTFTNAGTLRKSAGAGITTIGVPVNNSGLVQAQSGELDLSAGGTSGGSFTVAVGTTLGFAGAHTLSAAATLSGAGSVNFLSLNLSDTFTNAGSYNITGNTTVNGSSGGAATVALQGPVSLGTNLLTVSGNLFITPDQTLTGTVNLLGGQLGGSGNLTMGGTFNWMAGTTISGAGLLTFTPGSVINVSEGQFFKVLNQRMLINFSTITWTGTGGGLFLMNGANINNEAGALFDAQGNSPISGSGTFTNAGTLRKSAGTGATTINIPVNNPGTVQVNSGLIQISSSFSNSPTSVFSFPIGGRLSGTNYGQLAISGNFPLAGSLQVNLTNGFMPNVGDSFRILNWGSKTGGFTNASGFDLGNGLYFQGIADRSGLSLVTKTTVVPTPPPPTNLVNQTVAFDDTVVFSFSPLGVAPFTFQWLFNGTNLPGQTNATLVLTNVQATNLGNYCAVVVDALQLATNTYCAMLGALNPPGITAQPNGQTISSNTTLTLSATGNGGGPLRYQWRINGENIPGATNATYVITNAQPTNGGTYSVLVANPVRVISSSDAEVKVTSPPLAITDNFPGGATNGFSGVGSGSNTNATTQPGEPLHDGKAGGHSVWLQWLAPASGVATFNTRGSSFDTLLAVYTGTNVTNLTPIAADDDRADYFTSAAVFNAQAGTNYFIAVAGRASASGDLTLSWNLDTNLTQVPQIVQQPLDTTVTAGDPAIFSMFAASTTNLSYQWYLGDWLAIPGATTNTLILSNVSYLNVGTYSVQVSAATGESVESLPASLEIGPSHSYDKLEDLLDRLANGTNFVGSGGYGSLPAFNVSFPSVSVGTLGSQIINNFNSTTQQGEPIHADIIGGSSRWYLLTSVNNGTMVLDTLGSDIATVLAVYTGTDIFSLKQIASDVNDAPDGVRSLVKFAAVPTNYLIAVDGVNGAQGNLNLNWRMGVPPSPMGTVLNYLVTNGTAIMLQAGQGDGVTAPVFQWQRNGVNLAGATNATYALPSAQYNQVGSYSVVVSNLVGQLANTIATVSVVSPLGAALDVTAHPPVIRVTGSAGQGTVLQSSTDFSLWTPVQTNPTPLLPINYLDPSSPARAKGFYRLQPWP